jgi:hypothetical protein
MASVSSVSSAIGSLVGLLFWMIVNAGIGAIAVFMAKNRRLQTIPAFFLGFFASFLSLFVIALTPVKQKDPTPPS